MGEVSVIWYCVSIAGRWDVSAYLLRHGEVSILSIYSSRWTTRIITSTRFLGYLAILEGVVVLQPPTYETSSCRSSSIFEKAPEYWSRKFNNMVRSSAQSRWRAGPGTMSDKISLGGSSVTSLKMYTSLEYQPELSFLNGQWFLLLTSQCVFVVPTSVCYIDTFFYSVRYVFHSCLLCCHG